VGTRGRALGQKVRGKLPKTEGILAIMQKCGSNIVCLFQNISISYFTCCFKMAYIFILVIAYHREGSPPPPWDPPVCEAKLQLLSIMGHTLSQIIPALALPEFLKTF